MGLEFQISEGVGVGSRAPSSWNDQAGSEKNQDNKNSYTRSHKIIYIYNLIYEGAVLISAVNEFCVDCDTVVTTKNLIRTEVGSGQIDLYADFEG